MLSCSSSWARERKPRALLVCRMGMAFLFNTDYMLIRVGRGDGASSCGIHVLPHQPGRCWCFLWAWLVSLQLGRCVVEHWLVPASQC